MYMSAYKSEEHTRARLTINQKRFELNHRIPKVTSTHIPIGWPEVFFDGHIMHPGHEAGMKPLKPFRFGHHLDKVESLSSHWGLKVLCTTESPMHKHVHVCWWKTETRSYLVVHSSEHMYACACLRVCVFVCMCVCVCACICVTHVQYKWSAQEEMSEAKGGRDTADIHQETVTAMVLHLHLYRHVQACI